MASKSSAATNLVPEPAQAPTQVVKYSVTEEDMRETRAKYSAISFATPDGYEEGRKALAYLRTTRVGVDKERKKLTADSVAWQKHVNGVANQITALIVEIEEELQAKKAEADEERARQRRAKEDAEREALRLQEEAKLAEQRAQLEAERQAIADAQAKLAEEQRLAREAVEAQQAEERQKLEAEKLALEQARAELAEQRRIAEEATEQLAAERQAVDADREVLAQAGAELARVQEEVTAKVAAFEEAATAPPAQPVAQVLPPDSSDWVSAPALAGEAAAMHAFARQIRALKAPEVTTDTAAAIIEQVEFMLSEAAQALESFETQEAAAE